MASELRKQRDSERRERTRRALLEAAGKVFARSGYHDTQVSHIVGEIGVGQGTFYRHFDSKRAVAGALFEQLAESLLAEFTPMDAPLPAGVEEYRGASVAAALRAVRAPFVRCDRSATWHCCSCARAHPSTPRSMSR